MTDNLPSWFEKGRPSLFAALEQACKQIDADIRAELKSETSPEVGSHQQWQDGKEGESWQWEYCDDYEPGVEMCSSRDAGKNSTGRRFTWRKKVPIDWKTEYSKLQARYIALDKNFKLLKETSYRLRDERKEFRDKTKSLHDLILDAEQRHGIQILGASSRGEEISQALQAELNAPDPIRGGSFTSVDEPENGQRGVSAASFHEPTEGRVEIKQEGSEDGHSESTQDEPEGRTNNDLPPLPADNQQEVAVKEEPSSDGPIFISERCTNKRKRNDHEENVGTPVARVKTENGRSSPEMSAHRCDFNPHESIDLGEPPPFMWTPRKQRQKELDASQRMVQSVEVPEQEQLPPRTDGYAIAEPPRPSNFTSALTPLNVNRRQLLAPTTADSGEKPLRKGLSHGIQELAEDGGIYKRDQNHPKDNHPAAKGRLDSLLNSPSAADDQTPLHRSSRRPHAAPTTPHAELGVPKPRALPFDGNSRTTAKAMSFQTPQSRPPLADTTNTFPRAKAGVGSNKKLSPKKGSGSLLRNKPVTELRAEDFRINPNANKGHDYAFSEVVRDKDERAKLPGCVDEHCCGPMFRALAESEYPDDPTKGEWRQAEQKLLEDYLGDYAHRLTGMTKAERKGLWIEARMQQIANKHGKHKHHTSRMRSPPGFWQFDFPNTQEIEAEREEAARREKQKVQERHREAMRPGGRWLFRDE